jgi:predicted RNA binding protein YcfA (HicA-like mRNA interferase family)
VTSRLPAVTPRQAIRALERWGWQLDRVQGSHRVFRHPDHPHRIVVPMHAGDLATGTLAQIIQSSGLTRDDFLKLI